jgi:hypothetical protein
MARKPGGARDKEGLRRAAPPLIDGFSKATDNMIEKQANEGDGKKERDIDL